MQYRNELTNMFDVLHLSIGTLLSDCIKVTYEWNINNVPMIEHTSGVNISLLLFATVYIMNTS